MKDRMLQAPHHTNSVSCTVQKKKREEGKEGKVRGDDKHSPYQDCCPHPGTAAAPPEKPWRWQRGRECCCWEDPCWGCSACPASHPPAGSPSPTAALVKTPPAPHLKAQRDGNRSDEPKAGLYSVLPPRFPWENNNTDASFITALNQSRTSPRAHTVL